MAIDQRDVSSTLRFMDDRALQQYAAMHKSDPYIFPLAFQESQNRQRLRMQQQGAQGMQPQPKVNEQALAQMAPPRAQPMPEDVGIATLPAPNMTMAAEGGILGYGDDANFAERSEPVVMMAGGGVARFAGEGPSLVRGDFFSQLDQQKADQINQLNGQLAVIEPQLRAAAASGDQQAIQMYAQQAQAIRNQISAAREATGNRVGAIDKLTTPATPSADDSFRRQQDLAQFDAASNLYMTERAGKQAAAKPAPKPDAVPKADTGRRAKPAAETAAAKLPGISDLTTLRQQILDKQDYKDPAASGLLALEATERANAAAERQAIVSDAEKFKDAYKGREGRLAEREADIGKQKGQNTGLALLNAGLAIMSTPGGLATAIGKGAQVGTAQFAAGLDKIRSAQERLGEARDKLDDMKLNREENTTKEIRAAERNYRDVATNAQKRTIDGIRMAADVNEKRASDIYGKTVDMAKTMYEQGEANKRSAAGNRNNQLEMLQALQADPKLMATYRTMQGKNEDVMGQYNDFLKANPALAMDPKAAFTQFLMTKSAFAQLGVSPVTEKAAGPVRKQP